MTSLAIFVTWVTGSCISAEFLGYWLHRLMHSGAITFLSRRHMKHHLALYGPLHKQRSREYRDATDESASIGNIGVEWLAPAVVFLGLAFVVFHFAHVRWWWQLTYVATTLSWSFLMFSYLHDAMHVEGVWLEKSGWLRRWFRSARRRHGVHHCAINDHGLMDRNFGIGVFIFDRVFGTLSDNASGLNLAGFRVAQERFRFVLQERK
jgi:sterol desaturase/sphingolipid hydroxylase (fatty acid hydroxylase superfamily)